MSFGIGGLSRRSIQPPFSELLPPDEVVDEIEVQEEIENQEEARTATVPLDPIRSNEFAATLARAGVRKRFRELQVLMRKIGAAEPDIRAYGSGQIFRDLIAEFESEETGSVFDNQALFGNTKISSKTVISNTRNALSRVAAAMDRIRLALALANNIYDRVDDQVNASNAEYLSIEKRTENLLVWAYRSGAILDTAMSGKLKLGIETKQTRVVTDLYGLLNLLDEIILELETLLNIPAYYRTATSSDTSNIETPVKVVYVRRGESLETLALRELGDADKAPLIMEFNDLHPSDINDSNWNGRALNIPYIDQGQLDQLVNNFVLDAQTGITAMGRDIANEPVAFGGDLKLLNNTDTFFQSLDNLIQTPLGAIPEDPEYGNRAIQIQNGAIPQVVGQMVGAEFRRALMSNPRVQDVSHVKVTRDGDAIRVRYQVTAVNKLTEAELTAKLDAT